MHQKTRGKKMSAKKVSKATPKEKAPKIEKAFAPAISNEYRSLITATGETNSRAIEFIQFMGKQKSTQEIQKESMKRELKNVNIKPVILPSQVPAIPTACLILDAYKINASEVKAGAIMTLALRVNSDVKTENAPAHIAKFSTLEDLEKGTKTKAESQEANTKTPKEPATPKTAIELVRTFLKGVNGLPTSSLKLEKADIPTLLALLQITSQMAEATGLPKKEVAKV